MKIPLVNIADKQQGDNLPIAVGVQDEISVSRFLGSAIALGRKLEAADYVVNLCRDRYHFLLVFAATLIAGKTNIHPPNKQTDSLSEILENYPGSLCISDEPHAYAGMACTNMEDLIENHDDESGQVPCIDENHLAAIAFTSGSTGKPAPNKKTWGIFVGTTQRLAKRFGFYASEPVIVGTVPSQHMYGLEMTILMALHGGCTIHRNIPFFPKDIVMALESGLDSKPGPAAIEQKKVRKKVLVTTPVHLRALVETNTSSTHRPTNTTRLEKIISATAPLSNKLAEKAEEMGDCQLEEIYGCTEGGSIATRRTTKESSWTLLDGMTVTGRQQNEVMNEIVLTAEHLPDEVILQDQLILHSSHEFEFVGRHQDMLNVGGKKYSLVDLVQRLLEIDGVKDAAVFVLDGRDKVSRPAALVVSDITEKQIIKSLSKKVDPVFIPRPIKRVDQVPRNETGKVVKEQMQKLINLH